LIFTDKNKTKLVFSRIFISCYCFCYFNNIN